MVQFSHMGGQEDDEDIPNLTQYEFAIGTLWGILIVVTSLVCMLINESMTTKQRMMSLNTTVRALTYKVKNNFDDTYALTWAIQNHCPTCPTGEVKRLTSSFFYPSLESEIDTVLNVASSLMWNSTCIQVFWKMMKSNYRQTMNKLLGVYTKPDGLSHEFRMKDYYNCVAVETEEPICTNVPRRLMIRKAREVVCP